MSLSFTQSKLYTMENTMRKLPMLLVLPLSVLIFASCGGDDDDGPNAIFIVDTWNGFEFVISGCFDPRNDETITCDDPCIVATFTIDGALLLPQSKVHLMRLRQVLIPYQAVF